MSRMQLAPLQTCPGTFLNPWTPAIIDAYAESIPEQETPEQMWKRANKAPVPVGIAPKDQAYLCPICGVRFIGYRRTDDFTPAIRDTPSRKYVQTTCGLDSCEIQAMRIHYEERQAFFRSIRTSKEHSKSLDKKEEWDK